MPALKGGVIRAALSYSVEGKVVHYVDLDHTAKEVPLDRVDRAVSSELNRQRGAPFQLPPDELGPSVSGATTVRTIVSPESFSVRG